MATKSLQELGKTMQNWVKNETQKMQQDLYSGIVKDTPVKTGKARDGWTNQQINVVGDTGIINNDVEYIGWLEFGSDTVAPSAMVRTNIQRVIK